MYGGDDSSELGDGDEEEEDVCIVEGDVNTTRNWFGFLANLTMATDGWFSFVFTYPYDMQVGVTTAGVFNPTRSGFLLSSIVSFSGHFVFARYVCGYRVGF